MKYLRAEHGIDVAVGHLADSTRGELNAILDFDSSVT